MKPFAVCTDVELGPPLPPVGVVSNTQDEEALVEIDHDVFRRRWENVEKNMSSTDPNKPKGGLERHPFTRPRPSNDSQPIYCNQAPAKASLVEAMSTFDVQDDERLKNCVPVFHGFDKTNLFAQAIHTAFYEHYGLRLGPDVIWLTILQGLAKHIDQDPEGQRKHFVNFEQGKKTLVVNRPEFVKGSPNNDWTTVFPEFAGKIEAFLGKEKASIMTCDFSTSTPTDQICSHIALMDTVKHYFSFVMRCGCGIPSIELTGTVDDWVSLRQKAEFLCQFDDLEWWTKELFPVLDHFVKAAKGNPDIKFWKSVCNLYGASGSFSKYVTGWVQVFFPYTSKGERCARLGDWRKNYEFGTGRETEDFNRGERPETFSYCFDPGPDKITFGLKLEDIPVGVSQAPFKYHDVATGQSFDMTFNGGIVAVFQNTKTKTLEPVTGWAVLDHGPA